MSRQNSSDSREGIELDSFDRILGQTQCSSGGSAHRNNYISRSDAGRPVAEGNAEVGSPEHRSCSGGSHARNEWAGPEAGSRESEP